MSTPEPEGSRLCLKGRHCTAALPKPLASARGSSEISIQSETKDPNVQDCCNARNLNEEKTDIQQSKHAASFASERRTLPK